MRIHYLQHVPFEGLGSIRPYLESYNYEITNTPFFVSTELPDQESVDMLIVMGGPMSVNEEDKFPWLAREKQFIRETIKSGKPVLGICLGAQLIASAMGAVVYRNSFKEIGWFSIKGISHNSSMVFGFPPSVNVFHWHGETFDLPPDAIHLAESRGCKNQAFQIGRSVVGLQFHLETTPEATREFVSNCRDELVSSKYVQTEEEILAVDHLNYTSINLLMNKLLSFLLEKNRR
jgi:GMP synthase-like glutamine amidotransferase